MIPSTHRAYTIPWMLRCLLRCLGSLLLLATLTLSCPAQGQPPPGQPPPKSPATPTGPATEERGPPVFAYFVAILITILILTVVCMPSRKR